MRRLVSFAVLVFVFGCVHTNAVLLDPSMGPLPPVDPDQVRIFTAESELDSVNYTRVALIEASGSGEYTDQTAMIKAMREKAGKLGANGILLPQIQEPGAGAKVAAALFGVGTERKGSVVAIRVWDEEDERALGDQVNTSSVEVMSGPRLGEGVMMCPGRETYLKVTRKTKAQQMQAGCGFATKSISVEPLEVVGELTRVRVSSGGDWWVQTKDVEGN